MNYESKEYKKYKKRQKIKQIDNFLSELRFYLIHGQTKTEYQNKKLIKLMEVAC